MKKEQLELVLAPETNQPWALVDSKGVVRVSCDETGHIYVRGHVRRPPLCNEDYIQNPLRTLFIVMLATAGKAISTELRLFLDSELHNPKLAPTSIFSEFVEGEGTVYIWMFPAVTNEPFAVIPPRYEMEISLLSDLDSCDIRGGTLTELGRNGLNNYLSRIDPDTGEQIPFPLTYAGLYAMAGGVGEAPTNPLDSLSLLEVMGEWLVRVRSTGLRLKRRINRDTVVSRVSSKFEKDGFSLVRNFEVTSKRTGKLPTKDQLVKSFDEMIAQLPIGNETSDPNEQTTEPCEVANPPVCECVHYPNSVDLVMDGEVVGSIQGDGTVRIWGVADGDTEEYISNKAGWVAKLLDYVLTNEPSDYTRLAALFVYNEAMRFRVTDVIPVKQFEGICGRITNITLTHNGQALLVEAPFRTISTQLHELSEAMDKYYRPTDNDMCRIYAEVDVFRRRYLDQLPANLI